MTAIFIGKRISRARKKSGRQKSSNKCRTSESPEQVETAPLMEGAWCSIDSLTISEWSCCKYGIPLRGLSNMSEMNWVQYHYVCGEISSVLRNLSRNGVARPEHGVARYTVGMYR